tara:strand:+ start:14233 stop:15975 length:1743 start_codon:yes stop_codon:yes gene_type:complete
MRNLSVLDRRWVIKPANQQSIESLCQKKNLNHTFSKILTSKGISESNYDNYIDPKIKNFLPNPFIFKDMEEAIKKIYFHIIGKNKITLYGDYDVDGASSCAILSKYLKNLGVDHDIYIPDRVKDGYGPNIKAFEKIIYNQSKLIIMLDCGTQSFDSIAYANQKEVDTIVIDHHKSIEIIPKAHAIINPNRFDEDGAYGYLCAAGLVFIFLVALNRHLINEKYFIKNNLIIPDLLDFLDIVMLGTVCDVVPLIELNRAFVKQGLKIMSKRKNLGLKTLSDMSEISFMPTSKDVGFKIGPKINAGGRIGQSDLGVNLLLSSEPENAYLISKQLHDLNLKRRDLENKVLIEAIEKADIEKKNNIIVLHSSDWHEGIIGIIASRIVDLYNKPCIVISTQKNTAKGSARSVQGFDIGLAIIKAKQKNLIIRGGGHAMAGGFSIEAKNIDLFKSEINNLLNKNDTKLNNDLLIDLVLSPQALDDNFIKYIEMLEPFGSSNKEPVLMLNNIEVSKAKIIKNSHIKCFFKTVNRYIDVMSFNSVGKPIGEYLLKAKKSRFDAVCKVSINYWNNRQNLQLILLDLKVLN